MITPDGREIVFAGAGILWGATTLFRGVRIWLAERPASKRKAVLPTSMIIGFALVLGCSAYIAVSFRNSLR